MVSLHSQEFLGAKRVSLYLLVYYSSLIAIALLNIFQGEKVFPNSVKSKNNIKPQLYSALVSLIIKNHVSSELFQWSYGSQNVELPSTMSTFNQNVPLSLFLPKMSQRLVSFKALFQDNTIGRVEGTIMELLEKRLHIRQEFMTNAQGARWYLAFQWFIWYVCLY